MSLALLIAGHGSRDADGIAEFLDLARHFRAFRPDLPLEIAFLEFARPTIQEGIDRLVAQGADPIVVLPGVLMAAGHAKNDMASEVRRARERHPGVTFHMGRALDVEPLILRLCHARYREALDGRPAIDPAETLLLLVGRGSSDPDANSNIAKMARFLQEGYPAAWAGVAFSGIARPLLDEALPVCERMGFRRIVVQPYFLFTGILLKRIYATVAERQRQRPDLEFVAVPHLQAHPLLLEAFAHRLDEALSGAGYMNCSLCQYRVPILGHEGAVGEPQQPHHHHVQGLHSHVHSLDGTAHSHAHHHGHPHDHDPVPPDAGDPHAWDRDLLQRLQF
ncbi:MAG: sirohydrochlorin chelatase [Gemmataceae bacterium]|nr:sirohydrochlorin chelatase [Gemmataceae bacterium]